MLVDKLAGICHVIEVARQTGSERVLVTSSGAVYGRQPADIEKIPETCTGAPDPMDAGSAYGNGKRLVEQFCAVNGDLAIVVARCFSFLGPHLPLDARFAAGNFIRDVLAGQPITLQGDGRAVRSYLYAGDLVVWLLTLLLEGKPGTAYNVGSDEAVTIAELAARIGAQAGHPELRILGTAAEGPAERYVPCIDRARDHCGLRVYTRLDEAIRRTLDWHLPAWKSRLRS
jgi:dTDP-glucose 4,6-dehydratase